MKNKYEIRGNVTAIFLTNDIKETLIDTVDLPKLLAINTSWYLYENYVYGSFYLGKKKQKKVRLHRFLMDAKPGEIVDHINHNTLDNRKCNLRSVDETTNMQNQSNPKNVYLDKRSNLYYAMIRVNKKPYYSRYFKTFDEAKAEAIKMRANLMPGSYEYLNNDKKEEVDLQDPEKPRGNNTSGYRYISYQKAIKKWRVKYKSVYYGDFEDINDALIKLENVKKEKNKEVS
ncbi:hypothetical protein ACFQ3J_00435 [Paenibacillus provencensis]|uniref:HNH endonuclease n=1 Tax=Paenibacillus provencensis TaxID=441151 RepID=A0ABW3PNV2_9BACL|nr:hypothetical protein [Paenibacillus sp. MER 78]MCM3130939.1 hypothetical protein [Paenibacillus sp. MER 78]